MIPAAQRNSQLYNTSMAGTGVLRNLALNLEFRNSMWLLQGMTGLRNARWTCNWHRENLEKIGLLQKFSDFSVQKYKTPSKITKGIIVYETWGKTEAKVKNGGADIGLEITQSGSSIRNYGLTIIDTVMESETGIWINPVLKNDHFKK